MRILLLITMLSTLIFCQENHKESTQIINEQSAVNKKGVDKYLKKKTKKENKLVAKVGKIEILQSDIDRAVNGKLQSTFFHKSISDENRKEYNETALNEIIENELVYSYAKRKGFKVKEEILKERKENITKNFKTKEDFEKQLKLSGITEEEIDRNIEMSELLLVVYRDKIKTTFTNDELKEYYEKNKYKFLRPEARKVQIISSNIDPTVEDGLKKAEKSINESYQKIKNGEDFGDVAAKYSNDMYRIKGGDLGFIHKGEKPEIDDIVFSLEKDKLSEIIQTDTVFYFLKIQEIKPEKQINFKKSKLQLEKDLKKRIEKEKLNAILDEEKNFVKVEKY